MIAAILIFTVTSVGAANQTDVMQQDSSQLDTTDDVVTNKASDIKTTIKSEDTTIIKGSYFSVKLTDENSNALANKTVQFNVNKITKNSTTNGDGIAKLKISLKPGTYTVKYSFSASGFVKSKNSTSILVLSTSTSKITASSYTAYAGFKNTYSVTLTAGDTPLSGKTVVFKINGKTFKKKTNSNGVAKINIDEAPGSYMLSYSYGGEKNINSTSGNVKIAVKKGMPTKISKYYSKTYVNKKAGYFKIKLTDARGSPLKSKKVVFKLKGKKYTRKTNANGIAAIKVKLKTGSYKVKVSFAKTALYKKTSKTFKIRVKSKSITNNGMWLFGRDMKSVDLAKLQKYGFKHIFLNFKALELHGKSGVEKWVKKARSHGIKVHIWMQVFYNSGWQNPVSNGKINHKMINSKVSEAKKYAKIKGIAGVHFDYVRYPGTASQYKNSVNAINTLIKKASTQIHKINKKLIVSAAVMPEPSSMKSAYGQDIPTMSKYLNAIVPMVYKENYNGGTKWIKFVTSTFAKQSKKAQIWTGLQTYKSGSGLNKLSAKELMGDATAASQAGARGIILFRYALFNYINFNEV